MHIWCFKESRNIQILATVIQTLIYFHAKITSLPLFCEPVSLSSQFKSSEFCENETIGKYCLLISSLHYICTQIFKSLRIYWFRARINRVGCLCIFSVIMNSNYYSYFLMTGRTCKSNIFIVICLMFPFLLIIFILLTIFSINLSLG